MCIRIAAFEYLWADRQSDIADSHEERSCEETVEMSVSQLSLHVLRTVSEPVVIFGVRAAA